MTDVEQGTYWVAGYALATQSVFPHERLTNSVYEQALDLLEDRNWVRRPTSDEAVHAVDVRGAAVNDPDVGHLLDRALDAMPSGVDLCIVDLRPAIVVGKIDAEYPQAFTVITERLHWRIDSGQLGGTHVLTIVPKLGTKHEVGFRRLFDLAATTSALSIVDVSGAVESRRFAKPDKGLAELLGHIADEPAAALESKMIRRFGVFQRIGTDGEVDGHTHWFYDGRYCNEELIALFKREFEHSAEKDAPTAVVYDEGPSRWLAAPVVHAVSDIDPGLGIEPALSRAEIEADPDSGGAIRNLILVVPVFDRGDSLKRLDAAATKWAKAAKVSAVCVVNTARPRSASPGGPWRSKQKINGRDVPLCSLMTCPQQTVSTDASAPDLSYYEAGTDSGERFLAFTAGHFWSLADEAGFIPERNPPSYRTPLARVPDLVPFVEQNGAWIAHKMAWAIDMLAGSSVTDVKLALVADEDGAMRLAQVLADTLGNNPLRVPRDKLEQWAAAPKPKTITRWREQNDLWFREVDETHGRVVVIDEFSLSGRTLANMAGLFTALGFDVRLVLALAAFSRSAFERKLNGHKHFALYSTEWDRRETADRISRRPGPGDGRIGVGAAS